VVYIFLDRLQHWWWRQLGVERQRTGGPIEVEA
jgi:hypothetical protein